MTTVKIRYEINETYGCISGTQTCLYLIPSKESESGDVELYLWSNVGPGEPMNANQNRWFSLGSPGTNLMGLDGENLEECAESEADFALDSGVRLDLEEVKQYLLDKLREKLDEMEMEEDDEVDEKLRDKFRALVAT